MTIDALWLLFKERIGRLLNLSGAPGFVRPCDYHASITRANIFVRTNPLFTVIRVNGLDVYFSRLTGKIDGVGFSPPSDYTLDLAGRSVDLDVPPSAVPRLSHTEIQSGRSE